MAVQINIPYEAIADFCQRHRIKRMMLFGSVLREDFGPDSDVDVLVEYEAGAVVTLLDMAAQELELGKLLGRKVDLRTPEDLSRYFRQQVMQRAALIYG